MPNTWPYQAAHPGDRGEDETPDHSGCGATRQRVEESPHPDPPRDVGRSGSFFPPHEVVEKIIPFVLRKRGFTGDITICVEAISKHNPSGAVTIPPILHPDL